MEFRDLKTQYNVLQDEIDRAVLDTMKSGRFILSSTVEKFENELAEYVGRKYCITCGNGTDALYLSLLTHDIGPGDAVFVADFTFFASAEVISRVGATPIFVDINDRNFNMNPDALENAVKEFKTQNGLNLRAVIAVDLFGQPADYERIIPICEKYGLILIEDAAQGFGATLNDKKTCGFGDISTTSFFPAKPLGCYGDGGAIFTDDDKINDLLRSLRFHGKGDDKYDNIRIGMNSRLDALQAAILTVKFNAFRDYELKDVNVAADEYTKLLAETVITPYVPINIKSSWAQYCILLADKEQRDGLRKYLEECHIPTMIYFPKPMHAQKAFEYISIKEPACPVAQITCEHILALPIGPYITKEDIKLVSETIKDYIK